MDLAKFKEYSEGQTELKKARLRALFDAEFKRDNLRETLNEMAIWNIYDTQLISDICGTVQPNGDEIAPKKGHDTSVSAYVRKKAAKDQLKRRKKQQ